jgi:hypothetical protein
MLVFSIQITPRAAGKLSVPLADIPGLIVLPNRFVHTVELIKARRALAAERKRANGHRALQWSFFVLGAISILVAILAIGALPYFFAITFRLPNIEELQNLFDPISGKLLQPTKIYDQRGENLLLALSPGGIDRHFASLAEIPWLAKAYVASNQPDFWTANNSSIYEFLSPAKTIAENLTARIFLPIDKENWVNNFQIHLLSSEILANYSKEQILTWAINSADFGHWAFGAESAAQLYFGKPAAQLSLAESALLAAVAQAPTLNPIDNPELATRFQLLVLTSMREQGLISQAELEQAVAEHLIFTTDSERETASTEFTDLVIEQLENKLGYARVFRGDLVVTTTLDFALQQELDDTLSRLPENTGAVVLDPFNDRILALHGDATEPHAAENIFDPFSYLSAFVGGKVPSSLVWDVNNNGSSTALGPTTLRIALAYHIENIGRSLSQDPAIDGIRGKLFQVLGIENVQFGISLLQAGRAFEVFPQNGLFPITAASKTLLFVSDQSGRVILDWTQTDWQSIVSPESAYLVTDVLGDRTTSRTSLILDRPAAVFDDPGSSWWLAYSPQRVVAIWDGDHALDPPTKLSIFSAAHQGLTVKPWAIPGGLISAIVCVPSGQLPDEDCPETRREWFMRGSEPIETDTLYSRVVINSATGKLATVFTPEAFLQERVYMSIPSEAESWAERAGIPQAPQDYDPIPEISVDTSGTSITQPALFTSVGRQVHIFGSLSPDAIRFDIQVGTGLYPRQWTQLTEGRVTRRKGKLAEWDTEGLTGIWAIQLQSWDADGRITRAYTIVTISH